MGQAFRSGFPLHPVQDRHQHAPVHGEIGAEFGLRDPPEQIAFTGILHCFIIPSVFRYILIVGLGLLSVLSPGIARNKLHPLLQR